MGADGPSTPVSVVPFHCHVLQGVARVLSKLPTLQSMTQRLRSHSQRVLQPVAHQQLGHPATLDKAEEESMSCEPMQPDTDAHVVVFVHGFRVRITSGLGLVSSAMPCSQTVPHPQDTEKLSV